MAKKKAEKVEHKSVEYGQRQPSNDTGIYLSHHEHHWQEIGAERYPVGTWHPVFRCWQCHDVICDLSQEVDDPSMVAVFDKVLPDSAPERGSSSND